MVQGNNRVPSEFVEYFQGLYDNALNIMVERQQGYGPSNIEALGAYGVFSRLASDKVSRIASELNGVIDSGEAIVIDDWFTDGVRDALVDIANYAMILIALGEGKWSEVARANEYYGDAYEEFANDDDGGLAYEI